MKKIITISKTSSSIKYLLANDDKFYILYNLIGKISYSLDNDYYGFIIKTIIGQMLSNKVTDILIERLEKLCKSGKIDIKSIKNIPFDRLLTIGISRSKTQCIIDFTNYYSSNKYNRRKFSRLSDNEIIKEITIIKGLGNWSAKMFLLFVLGRENIIPYEDTAFLQAFLWYYNMKSIPLKSEIIRLCDKWTPYNSIVARYLYKALDNGFTKKPFASYKYFCKGGLKQNVSRTRKKASL